MESKTQLKQRYTVENLSYDMKIADSEWADTPITDLSNSQICATIERIRSYCDDDNEFRILIERTVEQAEEFTSRAYIDYYNVV